MTTFRDRAAASILTIALAAGILLTAATPASASGGVYVSGASFIACNTKAVAAVIKQRQLGRTVYETVGCHKVSSAPAAHRWQGEVKSR